MVCYDYAGIAIYILGIIAWVFLWKGLIGFERLTRNKLLNIAFYGAILVFIVNIVLACFTVSCNYDTELSVYSYVEQNATTISGLGLAIAVFVVIEFKEVGFLLRGNSAKIFLSLLLWSFLLSVIGCLPLYWIPARDGWLTVLRHIKTVPFTYSLFVLASAIIIFISELKTNLHEDSENSTEDAE